MRLYGQDKKNHPYSLFFIETGTWGSFAPVRGFSAIASTRICG
ncbi:hypothetical protein AtDm6_1461 [Acetobacter tropicalis]|uniref:Uncharacterized protein n=1 Tax=Acetobacter tropicalis TaxID=104102 RepID=A0A094YPQ5_9PROT|nr:hypothetical protein AtDm6_1461 [Acetobacter tropicalis]